VWDRQAQAPFFIGSQGRCPCRVALLLGGPGGLIQKHVVAGAGRQDNLMKI